MGGREMNYIPSDVDLDAYVHAVEFNAKVAKPSDFLERVKARLDPAAERAQHPSMLLSKARGLQFRPGEVTAWVGFNGHRKSMFTSQVCVEMAIQKRRVLVVSLEMDPADTLTRMVRQATGSSEPGNDLITKFHKWGDDKLWLFDHVGRLSVEKAFALCRYFRVEHQGTDVLLDSMMMICASEEKLDEQKAFSTGIVRLAQETGLHIHVVTHCRKPDAKGEERLPTRYDIRGSAAISDQAHNVVVVWMNKSKYARLEENPNDLEAHAEPCAVVKCDKQRNGAWEGKIKLWNHGPSLRFCEDRISAVTPYAFLRSGA
jgi:twinkle protein